jgi:hypothetical protein
VKAYLEPNRYLELATDYPVWRIENDILIPVRLAALGLESVYGSTARLSRRIARGCCGPECLLERLLPAAGISRQIFPVGSRIW